MSNPLRTFCSDDEATDHFSLSCSRLSSLRRNILEGPFHRIRLNHSIPDILSLEASSPGRCHRGLCAEVDKFLCESEIFLHKFLKCFLLIYLFHLIKTSHYCLFSDWTNYLSISSNSRSIPQRRYRPYINANQPTNKLWLAAFWPPAKILLSRCFFYPIQFF